MFKLTLFPKNTPVSMRKANYKSKMSHLLAICKVVCEDSNQVSAEYSVSCIQPNQQRETKKYKFGWRERKLSNGQKENRRGTRGNKERWKGRNRKG